MPKKGSNKKTPDGEDRLRGFEIGIDSFGNIKSNMDISKIREFLDERIDDKRLDHIREEE